MCKTYCTNCGDAVAEDNVRWAFDNAYCEHCFNNAFTYCEECDCVLMQSEANYSTGGYPYCDECYESEFDDDSPNNPDVDESDRKLIIELSRNWLFGKATHKGTLKINTNDVMLTRIKEKVGLVDHPIYLFGLKDREEYQLSVSSNLMDNVREFLMLNGLDWKVTEGIGSNRLGISLSIRENNFKEAIQLIKSVTKSHALQTA